MRTLLVHAVIFIVIPLLFGTSKRVWIAVDQFWNAYFKGWQDETLSSRAWRWERDGKRGWPRKAIDTLFFWEKDHCRKSYENERNGRQLPPELSRNK